VRGPRAILTRPHVAAPLKDRPLKNSVLRTHCHFLGALQAYIQTMTVTFQTTGNTYHYASRQGRSALEQIRAGVKLIGNSFARNRELGSRGATKLGARVPRCT
jgi:hypothetical protein